MIKKYIRKFKKVFADLTNKRSVSIPSEKKMVSFTFDDVPVSGIINGRKILEANGKKGTFYFSMSFMEGNDGNDDLYTSQDLLDCARQGHEIGCHTYSHLHYYNNWSKGDIIRDLEKNQDAVKKIDSSIKLENFSYPYGEQTMKAKAVASKFFTSSRSNDHGINIGKTDLNNLKSIRLYEKDYKLEQIFKILEEFNKTGGWLIFYTHDVQDDFSKYGCSENYLNSIVKKCIDLNIDIRNIKEATNFLYLK